MAPEIKTAFSILGVKFRAFNNEYSEGGRHALESMAAIARVALILLPVGYASSQRDFDTFVRRVRDLEVAEQNGVQSTRFDRIEESMDEARRLAVARFAWLVSV